MRRPDSIVRLLRVLGISVFAVASAVLIGGCTTPSRPTLAIESSAYDQAFQAACIAAKDAGMPPLVKDAVGGVIQGQPRLAGSLIEPWRFEDQDFTAALTNTINKQRRRVRIEFVPVDFRPPEPTGDGLLLGAVVPGSTIDEARSIDLLSHEGEIEVRVWVYVEREFIPNLQRSTWTRRGKLYARDPLDTQRPRDGTTRSSGTWTPVGRDVVMEERLLASIADALNPTTRQAINQGRRR